MKYDINNFYENMHSILKERNIPLKDVYLAIGMAQSNFSNAYNRKNGKKFSVEQMLAIAEYLNCSLDYLFTKNIHGTEGGFIKIPEMSKWTYADLFELIFALRKSESGLCFVNTHMKDIFDNDVDITAIYFDKEVNLDKRFYNKRLINDVIKEWSQILDSTKELDNESRELMLNTWEQKKIQQVKNILLDDKNNSYAIDANTKHYFPIHEEFTNFVF